jgi:uncharacterized protein YbjT (DUF2867 family)
MSKTATVIGATGLVGSYLLDELLHDPYYDSVRILVRRPIDLIHSKLEKKLVDFNDGDSMLVAMADSDSVFCAIGATQKKVKGDKEAYRKVDFDIPVNAARFCKMTGCDSFLLVSAVGANSKSSNFYLRLKGEVEDAVKAMGLKSVYAMRPSVLMGERKEFRLGEKVGQGVMNAFSFLLPSRLKPIHAKDVAKAMVAGARKREDGFFVWEYEEMR